MKAFEAIDLISLGDTLVSLTAAFILGGIIGLERQMRQRTAGLRTNVLVCVGAALFVDIAVRFFHLHGGPTSPLHVVAYVVSGVGFLGAGVIMREEGGVRGINTAATLWASAAVGSAAGADLLMEAIMGAAFVLAANTLLRPLVDRVNRQPIDTAAVEASHVISVVTTREQRQQAIDLLQRVLDTASIPLSDMEVETIGEDEVEIQAMLLPSSIGTRERQQVATQLRQASFITQVLWTTNTQD